MGVGYFMNNQIAFCFLRIFFGCVFFAQPARGVCLLNEGKKKMSAQIDVTQ
jgi:hypothetical protein